MKTFILILKTTLTASLIAFVALLILLIYQCYLENYIENNPVLAALGLISSGFILFFVFIFIRDIWS